MGHAVLASPIILPDSRELPRKLWTRDEYRFLSESGLLDDGRYELIEGEIIPIMSQGRRHIYVITQIFNLLIHIFGPQFVQSQGSLPIDGYNEPEPDTLVLDKPLAEYLEIEPKPENVRLAVEVSDSTLSKDRNVKAAVYARAGIAEYWIVNIPNRTLIVHRQPQADGYQSIVTLSETETVSPLAAPDASVKIADLLP